MDLKKLGVESLDNAELVSVDGGIIDGPGDVTIWDILKHIFDIFF